MIWKVWNKKIPEIRKAQNCAASLQGRHFVFNFTISFLVLRYEIIKKHVEGELNSKIFDIPVKHFFPPTAGPNKQRLQVPLLQAKSWLSQSKNNNIIISD